MTDLAKVDTTIYIGELALHRPVTAITDFLISVLGFFFFIALNKSDAKEIIFWKWFYLMISIATFLGGCSHGFFANRTEPGYMFFWLSMQLFNVVSVFLAQQATSNSVLLLSNKRNSWNYLSVIQLAIFLPSVFIFKSFVVISIDMALGLIPIMVLHFYDGKQNPSSKWVAYGILISFLTAVIHYSKFSISAYFNYLDIAHLLISINLSVLFIGVKQKATALSSL